ncbi:MAG: hypothetical protein RL514_1567 [Verrucomicrobiota bacterium]|jgi:hypothetical protein
MNSAAPGTPPWSGRRWTFVIVALGTLQLGAVWLLSARSRPPQRQPQVEFAARWLTAPTAMRAVDQLLLNDPTHLAAVNPRSFSGAWLRPAPPAYRPAEWREAERSFAQPTQTLGTAFQQVLPTGPATLFEPARKPATAPAAAVVAQPALRSASRLLVEGPLRDRPLLQAPALPSWPHTDVLADTRVQVSVSTEGLVQPPHLAPADRVNDPAQRAAQRTADQHALELARALRFAPAAKAPSARAATPSEGVLVFQWHTLAPPAPKPD